MRVVRDDAAGSNLREGPTPEIQVQPIGWRIAIDSYEQVGSPVVVVVSPSGVVIVVHGAAQIVGDAREASIFVILIEPVDSDSSRDEQVHKSVVVIVGPRRSLRAAGVGWNNAADGHSSERAAA